MNLQVVTQLADFMVERQEIWFKKEILKQPYPWTEDDRLKKGFFTNVYRDEDKTTKAVFKVLDTLKEPYLILYNIFCMNFFNYKPTIEKFFPIYTREDAEYIADEIQIMRSNGERVFTSAIFPPKPKKNSGDVFFNSKLILTSYYDQLEVDRTKIDSVSTAYELILLFCTFRSVGFFRAYEIYLSFVPYIKHWLREDGRAKFMEDDYVFIGPGARKLYVEIFGDNNYVFKKIYPKMLELQKVLREILVEKIFKFKDSEKTLTLRMIEGSMCEYRKYLTMRERRGSAVRSCVKMVLKESMS